MIKETEWLGNKLIGDPKLRISFNSPQCGWMSIGFSRGGMEFHTTTASSPYKNALEKLLSILIEIAGGAEMQERQFQWSRNPEEFDFLFSTDGENCSIRIVQYPTGNRSEDTAELVFSITCPRSELLSAFAATFKQLYLDREEDEFEFNWRQPFPEKAYLEFIELVN
jgi:hypothetical protein